MTAKNWMVQMLIGHGWDDAEWMEDDKPHRFATKEEAEAEIDAFIEDANSEGLDYQREDYRAVFSPDQQT